MKSSEFVKNYGWDYVEHILNDDAPLVMDLNYTDLKHLVESHKLVEHYGGLSFSKAQVQLVRAVIKSGIDLDEDVVFSLEKAIVDVESCM